MHGHRPILAPLLLALLLPPAAFSGTMPPPKIEPVGPPLFAVTVKGKTGFIDREGKVVIPATFGWVYAGFRHGLAQVMIDGKTGYINQKGEWVWKPSE